MDTKGLATSVRFQPGEIAQIKRIAIARSVESGNWKGFTSLIRESVIAHLGLNKGSQWNQLIQ